MPSIEKANEYEKIGDVSLRLSSLNTAMDECSMLHECTINGQTVVGDLDPSATHCFMDPSVAKRLGLTTVRKEYEVELGNGSKATAQWTTTATLTFDNVTSTDKIYVLLMQGAVKFIIRRKWLWTHNPDIDCRTGCVRIKQADGSTKILHPNNFKPNKNAITFKRISIKTMKKLERKRKAEIFAVRIKPAKKTSLFLPTFRTW